MVDICCNLIKKALLSFCCFAVGGSAPELFGKMKCRRHAGWKINHCAYAACDALVRTLLPLTLQLHLKLYARWKFHRVATKHITNTHGQVYELLYHLTYLFAAAAFLRRLILFIALPRRFLRRPQATCWQNVSSVSTQAKRSATE